MVKVLLVRHGNTFGPDDKVVWVGARTDLPLVPSGVKQAEVLAERLHELEIRPDVLLAGPLTRTRSHAAIAMPRPHADIRPTLREIDYGPWEAKSTEEIHAMGGEEKLTAWDKSFVWPEGVGWSPSKAEITTNVEEILDECRAPLTMIVTSNGILRFFAGFAENAADYTKLKVGTGNVCLMEEVGGKWRILYWNRPPEEVTLEP